MSNNAKKRILITGVSGLLGCNLAYYFRNQYDVVGIYHQHPVYIKGIQAIQSNLLEKKTFEDIVLAVRPDIITHCAALADVDRCETDQAFAYQTNVVATGHVIREFAHLKPKCIYISTDAVYEGTQGLYSEDAPLNPINYYARTKIEGEEVARCVSGCLIIRTSFYGWNLLPGKFSLAEWVIDQLSKNVSIKGFTNAISSNLYVQDFASILDGAITQKLEGTYNVGCKEGISKYDFARTLAGRCHFPVELIHPFDVDKFAFKARRGKDMSLAVGRIEEALQRQMPWAEQSMEHFLNEKGMWE